MANKNKKIEPIVSEDDDPTAELEIPVLRPNEKSDLEQESDARTCEFTEELRTGLSVSALRSDLQARTETIGRLQFDIEQLRAKWNGLEREIEARESQTERLNDEIGALEMAANRKDKLIRKRDKKIRSLKSQIQSHDEHDQQLNADLDALKQTIRDTEGEAREVRLSVDPAIAALSHKDFATRLQQSETYADSLRQQLQDALAAQAQDSGEVARNIQEMNELRSTSEELAEKLDSAEQSVKSASDELQELATEHEQEIRTVRFELGDAQNSVVEQEQINGELTANLLEVRGNRSDLEKNLIETQKASEEQAENLQKRIRKLERKSSALDQKLSTKSEAIGVLLNELARKTDQLDSISEIEEAIHDMDDRISERIDSDKAVPTERLTRLLVGTVDDQILRFPLFKKQLSIGRTEDNDIQIKAAYVSRKHAVVSTDQKGTRIVDWGSKNGVFVNSERVQEQHLQHGDLVTIGDARFRYEERKKRDD